MEPTNPEKLILYMLAEIHEKLEIKKRINATLVTRAIDTNNTWALSWEMPDIIGPVPEATPPVVVEVSNILEMWSFIEESYTSYGAIERARIKAAADAVGVSVLFAGFDGDNESPWFSVTRFLIEDLKRFARFKGRNFAASHPMLETYRRMLVVFGPIRTTISEPGLTEEQVLAILQA